MPNSALTQNLNDNRVNAHGNFFFAHFEWERDEDYTQSIEQFNAGDNHLP